MDEKSQNGIDCQILRYNYQKHERFSQQFNKNWKETQRINLGISKGVKDFNGQLKSLLNVIHRYNYQRSEKVKKKGGKVSKKIEYVQYVEKDESLEFSAKHVNKEISISSTNKKKNLNNIIKNEKYGLRSVFTNILRPTSNGKREMKIVLKEYEKKQIALIGLVNISSYLKKDKDKQFSEGIGEIGYCLDLSNGNITHANRSKKYMRPLPRRGDIIKVTFNSDTKNVGFSLISRDSKIELNFGTAFENVKGKNLVLGVSFFNNQTFVLL